jgi:uncharacterized GH25 family protein
MGNDNASCHEQELQASIQDAVDLALIVGHETATEDTVRLSKTRTGRGTLRSLANGDDTRYRQAMDCSRRNM